MSKEDYMGFQGIQGRWQGRQGQCWWNGEEDNENDNDGGDFEGHDLACLAYVVNFLYFGGSKTVI